MTKVERHARSLLIYHIIEEAGNLEELAALHKRIKRLSAAPHAKAVHAAVEKAIEDSFDCLERLAASGSAGRYLDEIPKS